MTNQYLTILQESLIKKSEVLDEIREYNDRQLQMFREDRVSMDEFDSYVEEKGRLIEKITRLDEGFENLYARISEEVAGNKQMYAEQIRMLQKLIREVTEKSISVQAQEARNKEQVEQYFRKERQGIGQRRQSSVAARNYYKNMNNINVVQPQFMDHKK